MRRALLAVFAALLCRPAAARDWANFDIPGRPVDYLSLLVLLPLAKAHELPHYGLGRHPYDPDSFARGSRSYSFGAHYGVQRLDGGRSAHHLLARARGQERIGWDFIGDLYNRGVFSPDRRGFLFSGHLTGNFVQEEHAMVEVGVGYGAFESPSARSGPSAELNAEIFPAKPVTIYGRYQPLLLDKRAYHVLSAGLGLAVGPVGLSGGWRSFITPLRTTVSGPEASLQLWF